LIQIRTTMDHIEQLYYALGELCYAMAKVDGTIRKEEKNKLHAILDAEFKGNNIGFEPAEIVFQILQKEGMESGPAYEWAIKELKLNSEYVSENLKKHFISVLHKVAEAFPPVSAKEGKLLDTFIKDLNAIHGDPVFSHLTEDHVELQKTKKS
jgi:uncharacterized tellurite resistance protein B-like protein